MYFQYVHTEKDRTLRSNRYQSSLFKNADQDVLEIIFKNLKTDGQTDERTERSRLTDATGELKEQLHFFSYNNCMAEIKRKNGFVIECYQQ